MNNNAKKKKEQRQSLYVTIVVIVMMVTVVVAIATSLARNPGVVEDTDDTSEQHAAEQEGEKPEKPEKDTEDVFLNEDEKDTEDGKTTDSPSSDTEKTDADRDEADSVQGTPLKIVAPVMGEVLRECSLEVPVYSSTMEDYRTHTGVDLYCAAGSDIAAAAAGTVEKIWDDPMMGTCVSISHSGGAMSVYKNLYDELPDGIEEGKAVSCGQIIATAGDTALIEIAEESHLHFELYMNGEAVDPSDYIEFSSEPVFAD